MRGRGPFENRMARGGGQIPSKPSGRVRASHFQRSCQGRKQHSPRSEPRTPVKDAQVIHPPHGRLPSPHPHPFQGRVQFGFPESHRPADLEIGDQTGHAPAIEVAFADPEVGAGVFFGEERGGGLFGARRIGWRVHAGVGRVNHFLTEWVATNGDNQIATAVPVGNMALKSDGQ